MVFDLELNFFLHNCAILSTYTPNLKIYLLWLQSYDSNNNLHATGCTKQMALGDSCHNLIGKLRHIS